MTIIAGCNPRIAAAFQEHGTFWLNTAPPENLSVDGFTMPAESTPAQRGKWERIAPTRLIHDLEASTQSTSDDWPFLYVSGKLIPNLTVRSMIVLGVLGIAMVYFFMPKGRLRLSSRMFFLGAAFMLLETKAVVQMALLFGSTWLVNSAVFFTVLVLILFANLYVLKMPSVRLGLHYAALLIFLAATVLVPFDAFLSEGIVWRYVVPCYACSWTDVLRGRNLRPLVPRRSQSRSSLRIQYRGISGRRIWPNHSPPFSASGTFSSWRSVFMSCRFGCLRAANQADGNGCANWKISHWMSIEQEAPLT